MNLNSTNWDSFTSSLNGAAQVILGQSILINLALLTVPVYTLQIFDRVLLSGRIETLIVLLMGVLIVCCAAYYLEHLRRQTMSAFANYLTEQIDAPLMASANSSSDRHLIAGLENFKQHLKTGALAGLCDSLWIPIAIVVSFVIHPVIGIFVLIVNAVLGACAWYKFRVLAPLEREYLATTLKNHDQVMTTPTQSAWLKQNATTGAFLEGVSLTSTSDQSASTIIYCCQYAMKWLFQLGLPTIGAGLLLADQLTVGGFLAALIVASRTLMPLDVMIGSAMSLHQHAQLLPEIKQKLCITETPEQGFAGEFQGVVHIRAASTDNAPFPARPLKEINLIAQSGDVIGLVGDASSGVTDLVRLIMGQTNTCQGDILFDGVRLADWQSDVLAKGIAWLPTDLDFSNITIMDLITHHGIVTETQAIKVATETGLNAALIEWKLDYDTELRSDWLQSRPGQQLQQLTLLTAACARPAQLLVLEYPERHLTQQQLSRLIGYLRQLASTGKTLIMATDSKLALESCGAAYCLDNGQIVRSGPAQTQLTEAKNNVRAIHQ